MVAGYCSGFDSGPGLGLRRRSWKFFFRIITERPFSSSDRATAYSSEINLTWKDNSNNEDGFKIERKTGSGGTYAQAGTVGVGVTSYLDSGLDCDTEYFFRVNAYNRAGSSGYSNEINATTETCLTNPPGGGLPGHN